MSWVLMLSVIFSINISSALFAFPRKLQPMLVQMATDRPDETVSIIVQKSSTGTQVDDGVTALGGTITKDLHIINGFAADLKAKDLLQLARLEGVRSVSLDAPMLKSYCVPCINTYNLKNAYIRAIRADRVWNESPYLQGQGITVAVIDSGITGQPDLDNSVGMSRITAETQICTGCDPYALGHGTHVAGIIGGNGANSYGAFIGVAPGVNLVNIKMMDGTGSATTSNVVSALQWVLDKRATYNIRVVNLSLNSAVQESYKTNPLDAAVEILWFNKIVVVVSSGNGGQNKVYPPANDPFVITVGATDDKGTSSIADDSVPSYSSYGQTVDGFAKPDLVAPGTNIISLTPGTNSVLVANHPDHLVYYNYSPYFRMSGTSMAAPMVTGAAALLIQSNPNLNPDQVKYRLKATANKNWAGYNATRAGAGYLDIYAAVHSTTTATANTGTAASNLLWTGSSPVTWGSVNWSSVNWSSVNWSSVNWSSVNWSSDYWGQ